MILDRELELNVADEVDPQRRYEARKHNPFWQNTCVWLLLLGVVIVLQILSGAYRGEFGGYPDEPAHYVTSLMLRDYFIHFHFGSPLQFAEDYYHHYPKVAFGHWPPFFYIVQAIWMSLFSAARASIRLEIACTTALLAFSIFREGRRLLGWRPALAGALLAACLPLVQTYSAEEMSETLLTLLCFWSVIHFARYMSSEKLTDGLFFALFFSLAVLTKGNGWLLAAVPPIALLLTRRLNILLRFSFWLPVAVIAAVCLPWQIMTMRMAERGWEGGSQPTLRYTAGALVEFLGLLPQILGPVLLVLMVAGIASYVVTPFFRRVLLPIWASLFALAVAVWVFHSIVPAGVEDRKLIIAVPAMVLFVVGGALWVANQLPEMTPLHRWRHAVALVVGALGFFLGTFYIPRVEHYGFTETASFLVGLPNPEQSPILVSSNSGGEGMLISEVAMNRPHPVETILRATKSLASVDWNGAGYHCNYTSPAQVLKFLRDEHVRYVVVDTFAPQVSFAHDALLKNTIALDKSFVLAKTIRSSSSGMPGEIRVYQFLN